MFTIKEIFHFFFLLSILMNGDGSDSFEMSY